MKTNMINVSVEFVIDALQARFDEVSHRWSCAPSEALWEQALQLVEECGMGENVTSPSIFVDNYLVNGDFVSKNEGVEYWITETSYSDANYESCEDTFNDAWNEYCENKAILFNADYACLSF